MKSIIFPQKPPGQAADEYITALSRATALRAKELLSNAGWEPTPELVYAFIAHGGRAAQALDIVSFSANFALTMLTVYALHPAMEYDNEGDHEMMHYYLERTGTFIDCRYAMARARVTMNILLVNRAETQAEIRAAIAGLAVGEIQMPTIMQALNAAFVNLDEAQCREAVQVIQAAFRDCHPVDPAHQAQLFSLSSRIGTLVETFPVLALEVAAANLWYAINHRLIENADAVALEAASQLSGITGAPLNTARGIWMPSQPGGGHHRNNAADFEADDGGEDDLIDDERWDEAVFE